MRTMLAIATLALATDAGAASMVCETYGIGADGLKTDRQFTHMSTEGSDVLLVVRSRDAPPVAGAEPERYDVLWRSPNGLRIVAAKASSTDEKTLASPV